MLYAGLDLSRQKLDVHVLDETGETVELLAVHPDADALRTLAERIGPYGQPVEAAIESMNGARFVHDTLERFGPDVEIADAAKARGLAPLAAKTDKIDARVLAELARRELVPAIWLPDPSVRAERERARFRVSRSLSNLAQEPHPRHAHRLWPNRFRCQTCSGRAGASCSPPCQSLSPGRRRSQRACASQTSSKPRSTRSRPNSARRGPTTGTSPCS